MRTASTSDTVRRFYGEAIYGGDLDLIGKLMAPDYRAHPPGMDVPLDRAAFKQFNRMFLAAFPDLHITVEDEISVGDTTVLRMSVRGTHLGSFMNLPPSGRQARWTAISITRVVDGRIAEQWGEQDLLGVLQQLGPLPAPDHVPA